MSELKWTRGPWEVCELDRRAVVESGNELVIADVRDWRNPANAHLIAAAPDLYAELQRLVMSLQPFERDGEMDLPGVATLNGPRRALAKARGEDS